MSYSRLLEPPLLILIDIQNEHAAEGRPLFVEAHEMVLRNCRRLLELARENRWLIAHCLTRAPSALFAVGSPFARPLPGFEPRRNEFVYTRASLSAYGSDAFERQMRANAGAPALLAGFTTPLSILATLYDAQSRRHAIALVGDAAAAPRVGRSTAEDVHHLSLELAAMMTAVTTTDRVCGEPGTLARGLIEGRT